MLGMQPRELPNVPDIRLRIEEGTSKAAHRAAFMYLSVKSAQSISSITLRSRGSTR